MRDRIARAFVWVLTVFPGTRRARPGRHSAEYLARRPEPAPLIICAARTPVPPHVLARTVPSPWGHRVPPYLRGWIADQEAEWERQRQRRVSAAAATLGYDVPFAPDRTGASVPAMSA
jgi:hypothetical protein